MPEWDPREIVAGTADAAFASDENGLIVGWNDAAEELLGSSASETVGTPCHEILRGRDTFGNRFCDVSCALTTMAQRQEPSHSFVLDARHSSGRRLPLRLIVIRLPGPEPSRFLMIHILTPAGPPGPRVIGDWAGPPSATEGSEQATPPRDENIRALTPREVEVLRLLAAGHASQDIANELFISLTTVRTHSQNILRKLDVHSQLEAVATAFRKGLI